MTVRYALADPTGNITLLVRTPVPVGEQPTVAERLMEREPTAEQVGFLSADGLRMAGGEFCGNATMAAAVLAAADEGLPTGNTVTRRLAVSGAKEPPTVTVTALPDGAYAGTVVMPPCRNIRTVSLPLEGRTVSLPVVEMDGISHIPVTGQLSREQAATVIHPWCRLLQADGLGILLLNETADTMEPLVYIPAADTVFWEHSCASGTTAVGAYFAATRQGFTSLALQQPGGTLTVLADKNGRLLLTGTVRLIKECTVP